MYFIPNLLCLIKNLSDNLIDGGLFWLDDLNHVRDIPHAHVASLFSHILLEE